MSKLHKVSEEDLTTEQDGETMLELESLLNLFNEIIVKINKLERKQ